MSADTPTAVSKVHRGEPCGVGDIADEPSVAGTIDEETVEGGVAADSRGSVACLGPIEHYANVESYDPAMTSETTQLTSAADFAATNPIRHPNESDEYRRARQQLLVEEIELRRHAERVASLRRSLPTGGEVPRDYHFVAEDGQDVTLEGLFGEHDTLVVYSYMFGPQRDAPCPMCTSLMGGFDHKIADIRQRVAIAFTARSPIDRLIAAKKARGWSNLPVFSDERGDYTRDYVAADDADMPAYNVFLRRDGKVSHFWSDEITGDMADPGQDPRGAVEMDPLWLLLDTTEQGRGTDWHPQLTY